jgi:hypothetical protein
VAGKPIETAGTVKRVLTLTQPHVQAMPDSYQQHRIQQQLLMVLPR